MNITRRQFLELTAASAGVLVAPTVFAQHTETTMARIQRTGRVRLGAIASALPYFTKDLATAEWKGFCIDLGRDLAKFLQVEVEWVETTWGNAVLDVQTNKIDAQLAMGPTTQRREAVDFSKPLFNNTNTIVAKQTFKVTRWEELNSPAIRIAVDIGSSHDQLATRILPKAEILRFESSAQATMALQSGRVDCQILTMLLSTALLAKLPSIGHIIFPTPEERSPTCIGIRKQTDQSFVTALNTWIDGAHKRGYIRETIVSNMQKLVNVQPTAFPAKLQF